MVDITILELRFDDAPNFGPSFGAEPSPDTESVEAEMAESGEAEDGGGPPVKGALLGLVLIGALALAAKFLRGGSEEEYDEPEMVDIDESTPIISDEEADETAD